MVLISKAEKYLIMVNQIEFTEFTWKGSQNFAPCFIFRAAEHYENLVTSQSEIQKDDVEQN